MFFVFVLPVLMGFFQLLQLRGLPGAGYEGVRSEGVVSHGDSDGGCLQYPAVLETAAECAANRVL